MEAHEQGWGFDDDDLNLNLGLDLDLDLEENDKELDPIETQLRLNEESSVRDMTHEKATVFAEQLTNESMMNVDLAAKHLEQVLDKADRNVDNGDVEIDELRFELEALEKESAADSVSAPPPVPPPPPAKESSPSLPRASKIAMPPLLIEQAVSVKPGSQKSTPPPSSSLQANDDSELRKMRAEMEKLTEKITQLELEKTTQQATHAKELAVVEALAKKTQNKLIAQLAFT
jgi:hypothetical protein